VKERDKTKREGSTRQRNEKLAFTDASWEEAPEREERVEIAARTNMRKRRMLSGSKYESPTSTNIAGQCIAGAGEPSHRAEGARLKGKEEEKVKRGKHPE